MGRRAETYDPIWTILDLYLPTVGCYERDKFRSDHFSRSGGFRVGKKSECSVGALLASLNDCIRTRFLMPTYCMYCFCALIFLVTK
jgi:hypothetical protein